MSRRSFATILLAVALLVTAPSGPAGVVYADSSFRRGDANADGAFDLSDPIVTLEFLFVRDLALPCGDAVDSNDTETIDIADAVYSLLFLFAGGAAPPDPFDACGADPSGDALDCASFPACEQALLTVEVSPERGGVLRSADGTFVLDIPAGAVAEPVTITARELSPAETPADLRGGDSLAAWALEPDGLVFVEPPRLTVTRSLDEFEDDADRGIAYRVPLVALRSSDGSLEQVGDDDSVIDVPGGIIEASGDVPHFSFAFIARGPVTVFIEPETVTTAVGDDGVGNVSIHRRTLRPCAGCDPVLIGELSFDSYDVVSAAPSVAEVVGHAEKQGMTFFGTPSDLVRTRCQQLGSARYGPVFSGEWEESGRFFGTSGHFSVRALIGERRCIRPQVELRKTVSDAVAEPGDIIEFEIIARLLEGAPVLTGITLEDVVPELFEIVRVSHGGEVRDGNTIVWPAGSLPDLRQSDLNIELGSYWVRVGDPGEGEVDVANIVEFDSNESDVFSAHQIVRVRRPPARAIVEFSRESSAPNGEVIPEGSWRAGLIIGVEGDETLRDVRVEEKIGDAGAGAPVPPIGAGGTFDGVDTVSWSLGDLAPGSTVELDYVVKAGLASNGPRVFSSRATLTTGDGRSASAEERVLVAPSLRDGPLQVTKRALFLDHPIDEAFPGERVTYEITLENTGDEVITDLFVVDDIFDPELLESVEPRNGGRFEPVARVLWSELPPLGPGQVATLTYDVKLRGDIDPLPALLFNRVVADGRIALADGRTRSTGTAAAAHTLRVGVPPMIVSLERVEGPDGAAAIFSDLGNRRIISLSSSGEEPMISIRDLDASDMRVTTLPVDPESAAGGFRISDDDAGFALQSSGAGLLFTTFPGVGGGAGGGALLKLERVDVNSAGDPGNSITFTAAISRSPYRVAFLSVSTNLVEGDANGAPDVFVRDIAAGTTVRATVASDGTEANAGAVGAAISGNGRVVAFGSTASNLVDGDTNGTSDAFVHDLETGETSRVSISSDGAQADNGTFAPEISGDGRFVVFSSGATNLVPGDTNGVPDAFRHDRLTGETRRVSVSSGGAQGDGGSFAPRVSGDGRYVVFTSQASNLVAGDGNGVIDVFVHDCETGMTARVNLREDGSEALEQARDPRISADGAVILMTTLDPLLSSDDNDRFDDYIAANPLHGQP